MPRPRLTPEERHARKKANALRYYYKKHATNKAKGLARYHARLATMSPEELAAFRAQQNETNHRLRADPTPEQLERKRASGRRSHHKHRGTLLPAMRERHHARRAEMTPEELAAELERRAAAGRRYYANHAEKIAQRKTIREVKAAMRQLVIATAKGVCTYCAHYNPTCKLCPNGAHKLTVDHITAIVHGGKSTLHNLIACCRSCNAKKRANPNPIMVQPLLL